MQKINSSRCDFSRKKIPFCLVKVQHNPRCFLYEIDFIGYQLLRQNIKKFSHNLHCLKCQKISGPEVVSGLDKFWYVPVSRSSANAE